MNQSLRSGLGLKTDDDAVKVVTEAVASIELDPRSTLKSDDVKAAEGVAVVSIAPSFLEPNEVPSPPDTKLHQRVVSSLMTRTVPSHLPQVASSNHPLAMNMGAMSMDKNNTSNESSNRNLSNLDRRNRETLESMPKDLADMKRVQHGVPPADMSSSNSFKLVQGGANAWPNQCINPTLYMAPSLPKLPPRPKYEHPLQRHQDSAYLCKEIRRIIIERIPEDRRKTYASHQIDKQAAIYEAFMFRYKISYRSYMDMTTLEERVIRCAKMAMGIIPSRDYKRPQLIVKINV